MAANLLVYSARHIEIRKFIRSRVQSILRKESTPSPPKENGLQHKKVMFDVSRDQELEHELEHELEQDLEYITSEITRTHSEEEFEYLEKSLIEHRESFVWIWCLSSLPGVKHNVQCTRFIIYILTYNSPIASL